MSDRMTARDATVADEVRRFDPITSPTLVDTVVEKLRESILSGRISPGERLVEAELARELGISRGPIREALAVLEKDGIVINVPRRGKFLPAFDAETIDELYSLRRMLEPYATQLLIGSLTPEKEAALREGLTAIVVAADEGDLTTLAQRDIEFHDRLYELSGHTLLRKVWTESIFGKVRMLLNVTIRTHPPRSTADNHRILVDAILERDNRRTRRLVTEHIDDAWKRARAALDEHDTTA